MANAGYWINENTRTFMSRGYLVPGQTVEDRIREIALAAEQTLGFNTPGFAGKVENAILNGWMSLSSPIWSNFGTNRGLPISCNNSYFEDTTASILLKSAEIGMMTKYGAGTSAYLGTLRSRNTPISTGGTSSGPVHFMGIIQEHVEVISQSNVRRGSCAVYLDIEHDDIMEFLECREEGSHIHNLSLGVCIGDEWMQSMIDGDGDKRKIWLRILRKRAETGYPYLFFRDAANRGRPQVYKDKSMLIHSSNLCTEIMEPSSPDESFVCDLLSLNDLHYDEWKNTDLVWVASMLLDAVLTEYIDKTKGIALMENARNFAMNHRAIGLGRLGYNSLLQSKMIAYESEEARALNIEISQFIDQESLKCSQWAADTLGEPPLLEGYGERWATRIAIAPTTSSSFILGAVSPAVDVENSNYYTKDLQKGKFTHKNPYLMTLLEAYSKNDDETWQSILMTGGSVQHLEFLTEHERAVFKTFGEVNQGEVIRQAADRQPFIDQGQSTNLMIHPDEDIKSVNALLIEAWRSGLKSLYYQRSTNVAQELGRSLVQCVACEA